MVAALALAACSPAEHLPAPLLGAHVHVEQGELVGASEGGVLRYRAIPYAAPPVGDLRWAPPQPPPPWPGSRPAAAAGPRCAQAAAPPDAPHATAASDSEDCLTLDVAVPDGTRADSRLPVLVWIHGGGFGAGAGSDVDARRLARAGPLAVVTVNYRLGALGFLGLPGLPGSGTFGLLDQQAALHWVRQNIAAFGGDPAHVTLGGAAAGADSVCSQLASPATVGLFRRAILQSGGCGSANLLDAVLPGTGPRGDTWKPLPLVEAAGVATAAALGCADTHADTTHADTHADAAAVLGCLRALPASRLVPGPPTTAPPTTAPLGTAPPGTALPGTAPPGTAPPGSAPPSGPGAHWSPATGTPALPRRPSDLITSRSLRPMPVLTGTTRDEGTLLTAAFLDRTGRPLTETAMGSMLVPAAGPRAAEAARAYRPLHRSPARAWADVVTDRAYACTALATYRGLGARAPLFAYEFADPSAPSTLRALPPDLDDGVAHGAELAYLFDLVPGQPALTVDQQAVAEEMVGAWARFVTTGDPAGPTWAWPRWTEGGQVLTIGGAGRPTTLRDAAAFSAAHHCDLWGR